VLAALAAALAGFILERGILRFLYGRPLETLLSTFGVSLVLIQLVRTFFGAQNVEVSNPSWMSGGIALMPNLILPFNRIVIMAFALTVVGIASLVLNKTRLGLYIRATTQNRRMAACSGIRTWQVDSYAFAFGAGIAGLGGCALSQIGNVRQKFRGVLVHGLPGNNPAHVSPQAAVLRGVGIALFVGVLMMDAMGGDPGDGTTFEG